MRFCSILPIKNQDMMFAQDWVMLLAHLSANHPKYAEAAAHHRGYKIMDNSIIELGSAFSMEQLVTEACRCGVNEIILPDVFRNGPETVQKAQESIEWLKQNGHLGEFKLMAVAHGTTLEEVERTIMSFKNMPLIDVIGIPKALSGCGLDRVKIAEYARNMTGKEIHLLGCGVSLTEYRGKDLSHIRSTDTCLPALLAKYNLSAWDFRPIAGTLDLEREEVDPDRYYKIENEFYKGL